MKAAVCYASRHGHTEGVAYKIQEELNHAGHDAVLYKVTENVPLESFDVIIIGSPVRYDRWVSEAVDFINTNEAALKEKKVYCFFTCLTLAKDTPKSRTGGAKYADTIRKINQTVRPVEVKGFAGGVKLKKVFIVARYVLKLIMLKNGLKEGDYRDWSKISAWAAEIK